jgi:hypothetical protein
VHEHHAIHELHAIFPAGRRHFLNISKTDSARFLTDDVFARRRRA